MSLNEARAVAKWARKSGKFLSVSVGTDRAACDLHNPRRHRMSGSEVVWVTRNAGPYVSAAYLWSKDETDVRVLDVKGE